MLKKEEDPNKTSRNKNTISEKIGELEDTAKETNQHEAQKNKTPHNINDCLIYLLTEVPEEKKLGKEEI